MSEIDCCENCVEGIEPCCDEIEVVEPTVVNDKYDIKQLAALVCCPGKFHPIYKTMAKLSDIELFIFRDQLRDYSGQARLHSLLELEFSTRLDVTYIGDDHE